MEPAELPPPLTLDALSAALDAHLRHAGGAFPRVVGLEGVVIARWVYRRWLARTREWFPLVVLRRDRSQPHGLDAAVWAARVAAGGWLFLDGDWSARDVELVRALAEPHAVRLVWQSEAPTWTIPAVLVNRLRHLDRFHAVETDPSLVHVRTSLLALCRSSAVVHLSGRAGSGRRSLAWWAHAVLDDGREMTPLRPDDPDPPEETLLDGRWLLLESAERLSDLKFRPLLRRLVLDRPLMRTTGERSVAFARPRDPAFDALIGDSPALCRVLDEVRRYAPTNASILIHGETGTGKELLARAIHDASVRRSGPFVAMDLSATPAGLLESELFGHRRGAFSGAVRDHVGAFVRAHGGTLFLDELGNADLATQVKLLRVLQERVVRPVGDTRATPVDVRVVAATNVDVQQLVSQGAFRQDLRYRFEITVSLPPLRARGHDVLVLAEHFLRAARQANHLPHEPRMTDEVRAALLDWAWPGNVRELRSAMGRIAVDCQEAAGQVSGETLGYLSPDRRAPAPVIVTSAGRAEEWRADPQVRDRVSALTLHVPALHERGRAALANAILASLDGRPIHPDTFHQLVERVWRGELTELDQVLRTLRDAIPGAIDDAGVRAVLPTLLERRTQAPIRALMHPTAIREPHGDRYRLCGLVQDFRRGAVLVGRAHDLDAVQPRGPGTEGRLAARWARVQRALRGVEPDFLALDHHLSLSRCHLLVRYADEPPSPEGLGVPPLELVLLAEGLDVQARPVTQAEFQSIGVGDTRGLGTAFEVRLHRPGRDESAEVYLDIYFFAGAVAFEEASRAFRPPALAPPPTTLLGTLSSPSAPSGPAISATPGRGHRLGELSAPTRAALIDLVMRFPGRNLREHIHKELEDPQRRVRLGVAAERLRAAVRPDHCLVAWFRAHALLAEELRQALLTSGDPAAARARLPTPLRELVGAR